MSLDKYNEFMDKPESIPKAPLVNDLFTPVHRTVVVIYPSLITIDESVKEVEVKSDIVSDERMARFLTSLNSEETIKVEILTLSCNNEMQFYYGPMDVKVKLPNAQTATALEKRFTDLVRALNKKYELVIEVNRLEA